MEHVPVFFLSFTEIIVLFYFSLFFERSVSRSPSPEENRMKHKDSGALGHLCTRVPI